MLGAMLAAAQGPLASAMSAAEESIAKGIGGLRSLSDADRSKATRDYALQIRALPVGGHRVQLAEGLANLSTEGDFGHETLVEVAKTLADSLKDEPQPDERGKPSFGYTELAQLNHYEHVGVRLSAPAYKAAMSDVEATENARKSINFTLTDIQGKDWTLSSLRGKVVLVNFWATWCPPCRKEMPDIETLYNRFKDQGLVVLAISDETEAKVKPFIADHGFTFPVLLDGGRKVNTLYSISGIPNSFVYDREGHLAATCIDMRTQGQFLDLLATVGLK